MANSKKHWFKDRGYLHFTQRITTEQRAKTIKIVGNEKWVAAHAFFPLMYKPITQRRYKKTGEKNARGRYIRAHSYKGKSSKKVRPIMCATHIDSQIYTYYADMLLRKYETYLTTKPALSVCPTAYRSIEVGDNTGNKCNIHFAKDVFEEIKKRGECVAMAFDIESFFSSLDHETLKTAWAKLLNEHKLPQDHYNVFKSLTNYSYINRNDIRLSPHKGFDEKQLATLRKKGIRAFFESPKAFREQIKSGKLPVHKNQFRNKEGKQIGIPQGTPISAVLANVYLLGFDEKIQLEIVDKYNAFYRRYSDDIIVICDNQDREKIEGLIYDCIKESKLKIAKQKTDVFYFKQHATKHQQLQVFKDVKGTLKQDVPLIYLGFEFYGHKTLIKSTNLARYYRRMKSAIKSKFKHLKKIADRDLLTEIALFKRKLYRTYTHIGKRKKKIETTIKKLTQNPLTGEYRLEQNKVGIGKDKTKGRKYRGNTLTYVDKAAQIMGGTDEKAIKHQYSRHFKVFENTLRRMAQKFELDIINLKA